MTKTGSPKLCLSLSLVTEISSSWVLAITFKFANPRSLSKIKPITREVSSWLDIVSWESFLISIVGSSIPLIAAPFLSTSKYWPKTLSEDKSSKSINQSLLTLRLFASSKSCPVDTFSEKPSLLVADIESLVATLLLIGKFCDDLNLVRLYDPNVISALPLFLPITGFLLITLIAPPVEFWPNKVPCGPLSTSILSISMKSVWRENGEAIKIPSIWKATDGAAIAFWLVSFPTPLIDMTVL